MLPGMINNMMSNGVGPHLISISANAYNINLRSLHDGLFPILGDKDKVIFTIDAGVIIGSTSIYSPAVNLGSWPTGLVPMLKLNGRIEGMGGSGSNPSGEKRLPGTPGGNGGDALYLRHLLEIIYGPSAQIWSGGGGGGSGGGTYGAAGGGGGGYNYGIGGYIPGAPGHNAGNGTTENGGAGGSPVSDGSALSPRDEISNGKRIAGGAGGSPGSNGVNGPNDPGYSILIGGAGGIAGRSIDGFSYITAIGIASIKGSTIN